MNSYKGHEVIEVGNYKKKTCSDCEQEKILKQFYKDSSKKDLKSIYCIVCANNRQKASMLKSKQLEAKPTEEFLKFKQEYQCDYRPVEEIKPLRFEIINGNNCMIMPSRV